MAVAAVLEGRDEDDTSARLVGTALAKHPDAVALYNSGGAVAAVAATSGGGAGRARSSTSATS